MRPTVFVPEPISERGMVLLRAEFDCIAPWEDGLKPSTIELNEMLPQADAVIVLFFAIGAEDLVRASRLKVIAKHGVGLDAIDVAGATRRRIPVVFTPSANANAVAEHTIALMLALARHIHPAAADLQAGRFEGYTKFAGVELAGKTLGILGFGRIGRRVAEIARHGFAMRVLAYDPFVAPGTGGEVAEVESSLETVLAAADFLSVHLPLTAETRRLINADRLRVMKPTCRLINTSRGGVLDESALAESLASRRLAGAALDVFEHEPLPLDHVLRSTPNLLLTPHIASATRESLERMACDAAHGAIDVLQGRRPAHVANPEVFE